MARYIGPVCKLCRREGMKLFLKGERCYTEKCSYTRRPYPPGQHGQGRIKLSEYAVRLREKQKVRRIYGVLERQFRGYFFEATRRKGRTGEEMLGLLERRLDNVVHRLGFAVIARRSAPARQAQPRARQRQARSTSRATSSQPGDKIEIREASRKIKFVAAAIAQADKRPIALVARARQARTSPAPSRALPVREELNEPPIREQYVVEYYSR